MTETVRAYGPDPEAVHKYYESLTPFWHPVARAEDVGEGPVGVLLLERPLVVVRLSGEIVVMDNVCRHLGSALSLGEVVSGETLRCRYHGWEYDKTGRCVRIPLRGDGEIPSMARVVRYRTEVRYGLVWTCLDPDSDAEIPDYAQFDDDDFHKGPLVVHRDWKASLPRLVMS